MLAAVLTAACSPNDPAQHTAADTSADAVADPLSAEAIEQIYWRSCHSCHGGGVNGAPRTGDSAAWAPRLAKGMDTLVANAINGYKAMPPRGLCFDCSEAQFAGLIRYMAAEQPKPE
ncbi:Cytochrome c5 [Microbulbifer marinus]|uniref:Cytochrome c5 n=2 Tax=Microbulbifer marinus TaxID=658218 RepID=A0A1H3VJQ2_9GAMM|nr:Cytochrome c5 [Microbulbifer marinus]